MAIGSNADVKHKMEKQVEKLSEEVDKVMNLLKDEHQAAWTLLSTSLSQQLDYSLSLQYTETSFFLFNNFLETNSLLNRGVSLKR